MPARRALVARAAALCVLLATVTLAVIPRDARADAIVVSVADLGAALAGADTVPDALRRLVLERLERRLDAAGLAFENGELLLADSIGATKLRSGCNRTDLRWLNVRARIAGDSTLVFGLDSLHEPIELALALRARLDAEGRARQRLGLRLFGRCRTLGSDNLSIEASGPLALSLRLRLTLSPRFERATGTLELHPRVSVDGELERFDIGVDVDDSLLESAVERLLRRRIEESFGAARARTAIASLERRARDALASELDADGVLRVVLPDPDDAQIRALVARFAPGARFPLPLAYVRAHARELLASLLLGDETRATAILGEAAACEAASVLRAPLPHRPLYALRDHGCSVVQIAESDAAGTEEPLHADRACRFPIDARRTPMADFCATVLDTGRLGNAAADPGSLERWTLSPGTRFDISPLPLARTAQPFTRRTLWKRVATARGECALEMRVHLAHPADTAARRPLIAFHGGSWQRRSTGFLGIESMAARFVDAGFVVFAPFYRLLDTEEGDAGCNGARFEDVLEDTRDALDWVLANAFRFGASGAPVLFGQSAGGHLAATLAVERPASVARAVLFYAPLDFGDFLDGVRRGDYANPSGIRTLERVLAAPLERLDPADPAVRANSFPERVAREGPVPPVFLLHGEADALLPARQSVRLCNALAGGDPARGPASVSDDAVADASDTDTRPLRRVIRCDAAGSELHLIRDGRHALDLCIAEGLCLAGSDESARLVADSLERMLDWIGGDHGATR